MVKTVFLHDMVYEHIGVMYLSSILKQNGHECDVFIQGYDGDIIKKAINTKPDIIAFSCMTGSHKWACNIAKKIKERYNCFILMGGHHPTYFPEIINEEGIDIICRGEGEYAILELANALREGKDIVKIENLWIKKDGKIYENKLRPLNQNLDELPIPDRAMYYDKYGFLKNNTRKNFITTRGCPFNCTFCYNHSLKKLYDGRGRYVRRRSVENVIKEILDVKSRYPLKMIQIVDDTFTLDYKWMKKFLKIYKQKINLPFGCAIRAGLVNEELAKDMRSAGCERVSFAIETGNESLRNTILKKGVTNKQILYTAKLMKKYGIKFRAYNMLGLPGETLDNAFETIRINREIKTDYPWCSLMQPYPKTEIYDYSLKQGFIEQSFSPDDHPALFWAEPKNMKIKKEIANLHKFFFYAVKFPWLDSIIKKLIKLPQNKIFDIIFLTGFAYTYIGSEKLGIINNFWFGIKNSINLFLKRN